MMPVNYIKQITENYVSQGYKAYKWVENKDTPPWLPLAKPIDQCRLGLIASGGVYIKGQIAFHYKDDTSFRAIPKDVKTRDLRATHFAYDLDEARTDPNVVFPIDTLRTLVSEGVIGDLADELYTFMGGIYSARRVKEELAPKLLDKLLQQQVDALLLVPV